MKFKHIAHGFLALAALSAITTALATKLPKTVHGDDLRVIDGDTVELDGINLRLVGIDTAETYRPRCAREKLAGEIAKLAIREILRGNTVTIHDTGRSGGYKRPLVRLEVNGKDVGQILLDEGYAIEWHHGEAAYAARLKHWCGG